ncbi:unnamed protein product [Owenia fusiformis]|uniref:EXPERA domain-containing protein n=1 Tax=Owenia fusiformis TaxID=6347 RepID=A0A8J1XYI7_OWEFU|nr:unnamed protein product [Owenia fusiformis]
MPGDHPYLPSSLQLPHYEPNTKPLLEILGIFFAIVTLVLIATWLILGKMQHGRLGVLLKIKLIWLVVSGLIHMVLEGYFSVFHRTLAGEQTLLAQMWKEYGLGDSRYIASDNFTVCMETITAFIDGPLCILTTVAFVKSHPLRYPLQLTVSLCQLYGDVLYFMTSYFDGFKHGEMWHPLYFWFYFVFLNSIWIIIPAILVADAFRNLMVAQEIFDKKNKIESFAPKSRNPKKKKQY